MQTRSLRSGGPHSRGMRAPTAFSSLREKMFTASQRNEFVIAEDSPSYFVPTLPKVFDSLAHRFEKLDMKLV